MFESVKQRVQLDKRFNSDARSEAASIWHLSQPIECLGKSHFALPFYVPFQSFAILFISCPLTILILLVFVLFAPFGCHPSFPIIIYGYMMLYVCDVMVSVSSDPIVVLPDSGGLLPLL